jgi:hypothetical protein
VVAEEGGADQRQPGEGRRVGKLYLPDGARYFGCRRCHDLTDTSTQEARKGDAMLGTIAARLGCSLRDVKRAPEEMTCRRVEGT